MTVTDRHPVGDSTPTVERPASVGEAADLLRDTNGALLFRGAGTKRAWGGRPTRPALTVETTRLTRLLAHNPADMTVAVEAGMPLHDLQQALGEKGQWLAFDPPSGTAGATIGGLLATGDSGPRRLRYGGLRDLVIGVTLIVADGTVARAGGKVIKNVAGYDLTKMLYGSLGTLGLVAEVVLRLHPRPGASATATVRCTASQATDLAIALLASPLEPVAVDWVQDDPAPGAATRVDAGRLAIRFEGTSAGVEAQRAATGELLRAAVGETLQALSGEPRWHVGEDEDRLWAELNAAHRAADSSTTVAAAATLPSRTPQVADALAEVAETGGLLARLASRPALGLHTAQLTGPADAVATAFERWRREVLEAGTGASVLLRDRPDDVDARVDAMGPPPSAVALLRALKDRLDPDNRCAPGRLGSWTAGAGGDGSAQTRPAPAIDRRGEVSA